MQAKNFILYTLLSLITFSGFLIINKIELGFYGIAWGSFIFSLIFIVLAAREFMNDRKILSAAEYIGMAVIAFIFFCKGWILLFSGMNMVYLIGLILLTLINLWSIRQLTTRKQELETRTYFRRIILRIVLIVFLLSESLNILGVDGYIYLASGTLILSLLTFLSIIWTQTAYFFAKNRLKEVIGIDTFSSYWLLLGFMLFFSYRLAVSFDVTDEVRFHRLPTEYVDLFYRAENGNEEPVEGKYEYEIYLEEYEEFMDSYIRVGE